MLFHKLKISLITHCFFLFLIDKKKGKQKNKNTNNKDRKRIKKYRSVRKYRLKNKSSATTGGSLDDLIGVATELKHMMDEGNPGKRTRNDLDEDEYESYSSCESYSSFEDEEEDGDY